MGFRRSRRGGVTVRARGRASVGAVARAIGAAAIVGVGVAPSACARHADRSADDAARPEDTRLWPLAPGRAWTYDVRASSDGGPCRSGTYVTDVAAAGARDTYRIDERCAPGRVDRSTCTASGDALDCTYEALGTPTRRIGAPVRDGAAWAYDGRTRMRWRDVGTVTVPAGTFTHCFRADAEGGAAYEVYCRGVGPVERFASGAEGEIRTTLRAANFPLPTAPAAAR